MNGDDQDQKRNPDQETTTRIPDSLSPPTSVPAWDQPEAERAADQDRQRTEPADQAGELCEVPWAGFRSHRLHRCDVMHEAHHGSEC
ncbi:MAG: hypothetical protein JOZ99_06855 [Actinobacteria bacterium]|nr:hypothetical protein [Actinomycetota bacterium]